MNAVGQVVVSAPLQNWGALTDEDGAERLLSAGVESVHDIAGFMEFPEFVTGPIGEGLYLYSVEGPRISAVQRLMMRAEAIGGHREQLIERLISAPESAVACALGLFEIPGIRPSREGWMLRGVRGIITQAEDPTLFSGVFYEALVDFHGDTCLFLPTATPIHYAQGDLAKMGVAGAVRASIWGYGREPFRLVENGDAG